MELGRLGVWYSTDKLTRAAHADLARRVERLGYGTLWYPESQFNESLAVGAFLLAATERLMVGSSIANIYGRDAVTSRNGLRTLNDASGGRYVLGLGVSHVPLVEGLRGHTYRAPVPTMRDYLDGIAARDPGKSCTALQVVIAALGPKMLALAGSHSRGAIPYNVTPEHTAKARGILGPGKLLAVEQKICLVGDAATARTVARAELARYLPMTNYRNSWLGMGFTEDDLAGGGSDRFLDGMVAWGSAADIEARLKAHVDAGADHVCIQPLDPEGKPVPHQAALEAFAPTGA